MSEAANIALESIRRHEGRVVDRAGRHVVYNDKDGSQVDWTQVCPNGHPTIGYGHNLRRGLDEITVMNILKLDVRVAEVEVANLIDRPFWFLSSARRAVLIEMCFAMGATAFAGFVDMVAAVREHEYDRAADEILGSDWARELPSRARVLAKQMRGLG